MKRNAATDRRTPPRCPRCGYDVSGESDRWTTQCPLTGVCPECGLTFEWRYLLNPALAAPAWLFDTNTSRFWGPLAQTLVRSLWPPKIATALRIEQEFSLQRSLVLFAVCALAMHATAMACGTVLAVREEHSWGPSGSYSFVESVASVDLDDLRMPQGALVRHMIWPYSHIFDWDVYYTLPTPAFGMLSGVWLVSMPIAFLPLTTSLRFARVRPVHIVRLAAYCAPSLALLMVTTMVYLSIGSDAHYYMFRTWVPWWNGAPFTMVWAGLTAGLFWFWWRWGIGRYMRMRHAGGVTLAVLSMAFLGAMMIILFTNSDLIDEMAQIVEFFVKW